MAKDDRIYGLWLPGYATIKWRAKMSAGVPHEGPFDTLACMICNTRMVVHYYSESFYTKALLAGKFL